MTGLLNSFAGSGKFSVRLGDFSSGLSVLSCSGIPEAGLRTVAGYADISPKFNITTNHRKEGSVSIYGNHAVEMTEFLLVESRDGADAAAESVVWSAGASAPEKLPCFSCRNVFEQVESPEFSIAAVEVLPLPAGADHSGLRFTISSFAAESAWSVARQEFRSLSDDFWQIQNAPVSLTVTCEEFFRREPARFAWKRLGRSSAAPARCSGRSVCIQNCRLVL